MATSTASKQHFVCPECECSVVPAPGQNGFLRCDKGHRLQGLHSRPLWLTLVFAFVIGFWPLSVLMHLIITFLPRAYHDEITWCLLAAAAFSCVHLVVVGRDYAGRPEPMRSLGRQYVTVGIGRAAAVLLLSGLAWMGIPN